jgi:hypothetical protein
MVHPMVRVRDSPGNLWAACPHAAFLGYFVPLSRGSHISRLKIRVFPGAMSCLKPQPVLTERQTKEKSFNREPREIREKETAG